jgi:Ca2+-binding EF-hand superfamily protein
MELSAEYKRALKSIFQQMDLDDNGTLSRTEFNLFNWRTSGEQVQV